MLPWFSNLTRTSMTWLSILNIDMYMYMCSDITDVSDSNISDIQISPHLNFFGFTVPSSSILCRTHEVAQKLYRVPSGSTIFCAIFILNTRKQLRCFHLHFRKWGFQGKTWSFWPMVLLMTNRMRNKCICHLNFLVACIFIIKRECLPTICIYIYIFLFSVHIWKAFFVTTIQTRNCIFPQEKA